MDSTEPTTCIRNDERSLDPPDWKVVGALGHRILDDMLAHVRDVRARPVWQPVPDAVRDALRAPVPRTGIGASAVYDEFVERVLPYGLGNIHPRFWGWVIGSGTFTGALAEFVAATMNVNVAGFATSAVLLEECVLSWLRQVLRMPPGTSGILTSGASVANLIGLRAALQARLGERYQASGVHGLERRPIVYASAETHFSIRRAVRVLGLGDASFHVVPSTPSHEIDVDALRDAITADRAAGHEPCIAVGNAGTVGVGAFDDCHALADVAAEHHLWLHVDGAFGAMLALVASDAWRIRGMERADSLACDLHKWLHVPFEAGCVLVRDADAHRASFAAGGAYVTDMPDGPATGVMRFADLGVQQSRAARAIKVWFTLREHGFDALGACVEMNLRQAEWLGERIASDVQLELLAPVTCNIVCYRCVPPGLTPAQLDQLNIEVLRRIQGRGLALPTAYTLHGTRAIRCCITNHRTTRADLEFLLACTHDIMREVAQEMSAEQGANIPSVNESV